LIGLGAGFIIMPILRFILGGKKNPDHESEEEQKETP
jgi:hypothetical protein